MNKERLMQFLSDAIDMGFDITISNPGSRINKEQAKAMAERFSSIVGGEVKDVETDENNWMAVRSTVGYYHGSFFHNESRKVTPCNT
jgi:hypothetical protein